jgi:hypothetical protein
MTKTLARSLPAIALFLIALSSPTVSRGQQLASGPLVASVAIADPSALPNAPSYSSSLAASEDGQTSGQTPGKTSGQAGAQPPAYTPAYEGDGTQTKRILGIIPNFRSVSVNQHLPPETVKEKFVDATQDSFDYSSVVLPAVVAGFNQARNATPEFHQGAAGYGRYFWHSFVDQTQENYWVEFIVPAIAHEDTRYYTLGYGGFKKRAVYSLSRVIITRDDAGKETFNSGEVLGAAFSSALSNAYYPPAERTVGNTLDQYVLNVGIDAGTYLFKEFWPDINHRLFHAAKPPGN